MTAANQLSGQGNATRRAARVAQALTIAAVLGTASATTATVLSNFDVDNEGWSVVDLPGGNYGIPGTPSSVTYHATGGNPGGYVSAFDPSWDAFFFEAPAKFLGDQSANYGGRLTFDLKVDLGGGSPWDEGVEVVLSSPGLTVVRDMGIDLAPPSDWQNYTFNLTESGWHTGNQYGPATTLAEFQSVLGSLSQVRIIGEYASGMVETASLDNVLLVPEPAWTASLAGLGLAGFVLLRQRRRLAKG